MKQWMQQRGRRWWNRSHRDDTKRAPRPRRTELEPAHDQPWVPRSALTDRLRRSPRQ